MNKWIVPGLAALGLALTWASAQAVPRIPEQSGWSGHVNLGLGVGSSESNMIDGVASIDLGQDTISNLDDGPGSEDFVLPQIHFEVAYTFAENLTQLYLGNQVVDYLSFDLETTLETHLGIRQEVPGITRVDVSLSASSLPVDVWKDPYVVDESRGDTERTSSGLHVGFDELFGTGFEFEWSAKEIELDDERSGQALGLADAERRLLRRTGNVYRVDLSYDWRINDRNRIVPAIGWVDFDLDGDAMAEDGPELAVRHLYEYNRWYIVSRLYYQDLESDSRNPVFGDERQMETLGGSVTAFYTRPFGLERWSATASLGYQDSDSNIDFYDASFGLFSLGMFYRFN